MRSVVIRTNQPHGTVVHEQYYILDLDNTLLDTPTFFDQAFVTALNSMEEGLGTKALEARLEEEGKGYSFQPMAWLEALKGRVFARQAQAAVSAASSLDSRAALWEKGAEKLLQQLQRAKIPYGVLTYGNAEFQALKMIALGLDEVPCGVIDHPRKVDYIIENFYKNNDTDWHIPGVFAGKATEVTARHIVLVDDKPEAFYGLPDHMSGYLVKTGRANLYTTKALEQLPARVKTIETLEQIVV